MSMRYIDELSIMSDIRCLYKNMHRISIYSFVDSEILVEYCFFLEMTTIITIIS